MEKEQENGSNSYQIRRLERFDKTYQALIKKHYRKDRKAREEFEQVVQNYIAQLQDNPCSESDPEPFPANTAESGWEFRKKRWKRLPGLQGSARFGRLIFLVCHPQKIVFLMWIYTHAEFSEPNSRPASDDLRTEINLAKTEILQE